MDKANPENIGKYYRWDNGLRLKVIGINQYDGEDEYKVCDPRNESHVWGCVVQNIKESDEISEADAKAAFALIEHNTPQVAFCNCCTWRLGRPNLSIKMKLPERLPADEAYRIEDEFNKFFSKLNIVPKVNRSDDGIHIEFFDMNEEHKNV
ncbi:MAG: hypothetical protein M0R80_08405 [Proteobacteria bacterium]|jgi:hypothetical protein|nr:hypothetical protein [Pseudomonadota bacterium]